MPHAPASRPPFWAATPARTVRRGHFWVPGERVERGGKTFQRGPMFVAWEAPEQVTRPYPDRAGAWRRLSGHRMARHAGRPSRLGAASGRGRVCHRDRRSSRSRPLAPAHRHHRADGAAVLLRGRAADLLSARPVGQAHAMAVRTRRRRGDGPVHRRLRPAAGGPRRLRGHGRRPPGAAARPDRAGDPAHAFGVRPERLAGGGPPAGSGPRHRQRRADGTALRRHPQHRPAALGSDGRAAHLRPAARLARGGARRRSRRRCACPTWPGCRSPW